MTPHLPSVRPRSACREQTRDIEKDKEGNERKDHTHEKAASNTVRDDLFALDRVCCFGKTESGSNYGHQTESHKDDAGIPPSGRKI
jgi:hypothetical protein